MRRGDGEPPEPGRQGGRVVIRHRLDIQTQLPMAAVAKCEQLTRGRDQSLQWKKKNKQ